MDFFAVHPASCLMQASGDSVLFVCEQFPGDGQQDVVCAVSRDVAHSDDAVVLGFDHILSQLRLSVRGTDELVDYVLRGIEISGSAAGAYELGTKGWELSERDTTIRFAFEDADAVELEKGAKASLFAGEGFTLIPGAFTVTVSWDCYMDGSLVASYISTTPSITLGMGCCHDVCLALSNSLAKPVSFLVTISDWRIVTQEVDLSDGASARP